MRRTLTLAALATAGLLRLDAATAFQFPIGARSAGGGAVSGLRPASLAASSVAGPRPKVASLCMDAGSSGGGGGAPTQAPEVPAVDAEAAVATEAPAAAAVAKEDGGEGEKAVAAAGEGVSSTEASAVKKPEAGEEVKAAPKKVKADAVPAPVKAKEAEPLSDLERAFAEAKKRSQEQGGAARVAAAAVKAAPEPKAKAPEAAGESKASPTVPKTAATPAAAAKPAAAKPVAAKPVAAAPKSEGLKARTTAGQVKKPAPVKGAPPKEAEVMKIKSKAQPEVSEAAEPKAEKEEPKPKAAEPKAKAAKAAPAEEKTGAFSLGAESLEEFFGLTKKPRLVSTTTPPSDDPEPTPMAELDPAAVERMIAQNGLNEVTLKENFRQMEAEAKAAQEGGEAPVSPEAKKIAAAAAKRATSLTPNPVVGVLSSIFSLGSATDPRTGDPDIAPPVPASKNAAVTEDKAVASRPKAVAAAKPKPVAAAKPAPKPKPVPKAVPKAVAPKAVAKVEAEQEEGVKEEGGLSGLLNGMFGAPIYDDEVDTIPKKESGAGRALPVFAPPSAPAKAPAKAPAAPAPAAKKKSDTPAASSFLDGVFGGSKKAAEPKEVAAPPAPTPAAVVKEKKAPAPSMFDGLFGGGASKGSPSSDSDEAPKRPRVSTPTAAAKAASPAKAPAKTPAKAPVKAIPASGGSESLFGGLFGGGAKGEKAKAVPPAPPAPAPAPAPAPKAPAFSMFGMKGGKEEKKASKPSPPAGIASKKKEVPKKAAPPAVAEKKATSGGMFDFLGGGGASKSAPPAPEPEPKPVPAKAASSNPFSSLFGGGAGKDEPSSKPKPPAGAQKKPKPKPKRAPAPPPTRPAPTPAVSRVKTMDDSFLRKVSVMLKRNQAKIKKFQQLTDRFRGGLIKAPVYYAGVEDLFGADNVEEIIGPLLAALPENDKRKTLQDVYNKAQKAKNSPEGDAKGGGIGGLFGGWGAKSDPKKGPTGGKAAPAPADPYAFAAAKLSAADFQVFKSRTVLFSKGGINARNYYDTLAKVFGAKGVPQQMPALMKALPQNKRKLLQDVVNGLSK